MSDNELPGPAKGVYLFFEFIALGFALEAVAAFVRGGSWFIWTGSLLLAALFLWAGIKGPLIKEKIGSTWSACSIKARWTAAVLGVLIIAGGLVFLGLWPTASRDTYSRSESQERSSAAPTVTLSTPRDVFENETQPDMTHMVFGLPRRGWVNVVGKKNPELRELQIPIKFIFDRTTKACMMTTFVDSTLPAFEVIAEIVNYVDPLSRWVRDPTLTGFAGFTEQGKDPVVLSSFSFSGKVIVYYAGPELTIQEQAQLDHLYRQRKLSLELRGEGYIGRALVN